MQPNTHNDDDHTILRHHVLTLNEPFNIGYPTSEVQSKRQRTDTNQFNESQLISCYSLSDNKRIDDHDKPLETNPDQKALTVVTYKKTRPAGVLMLFSPIERGRLFGG